ncbi:G-protein coupled receptors family 1 profile domain-containing protein [Caenorhabditis elegans]|uniref:G-protein coupled receptors family 1 profile domain-containing protein n=1 Tax=Caenorhabditis elegans TaxID=6239 RepID=Q9GYH2_CAEEL|nr:G-protein coupled receptors family 1 profile domain-containing protein [Caenorhabditis elegans]CCD72368.2 G-protein coupled receptors family 1 profile domain-containing protein [Caenorhabditis elegans]|eukprot:NP_001343679.1 FMRFamide Peptide Receptor family [Caenorhabditis elegans]
MPLYHYGETHFKLEHMSLNTTASSSLNSHSYDMVEVFAMIMLPLILIGIFGNIISIYVYSRHHMNKNTIGFLLLSLSTIDLIVLITAMPSFGTYKFPFFPGYHEIGSVHTIFSAFCLIYFYPLMCMGKMMGQYIIVLISVERWFAVCRPLQVQIWCTQKNTIRAMTCIIAISILFNAPRFFEFKANLITGVIGFGLAHISKNEWYFYLYYGIRAIIFDALIPFSIIAVTNIQVIQQLRKSNEERKLMTTQQQKDNKTTTMLLVMIFMYAICHFLCTSVKFINLFSHNYVQFQFVIFKIIHHISNVLLVFYSASTFFIYLIFSEKYRNVLSTCVTCRNTDELTVSSRGRQNTKTTRSNSQNGYTAIKNEKT